MSSLKFKKPIHDNHFIYTTQEFRNVEHSYVDVCFERKVEKVTSDSNELICCTCIVLLFGFLEVVRVSSLACRYFIVYIIVR